MSSNAKTLLVEIVAFAVILWVLFKYVLPYVARAVRDRQAQIRESLETAEEQRHLLSSSEQRHRARVEEAEREAAAIREQAQRMTEQLRVDMERRAREEYEATIARAEVEIRRAAERASDDIRHRLADLVVDTAERVLARQLSAEAHAALIDEAIAGVESHA